jgi:uncharacterized protein
VVPACRAGQKARVTGVSGVTGGRDRPVRPEGRRSGHILPVELSRQEARRTALRAQGFVGHRSGSDASRLRAIASRLGSLQVDAVNVLVRSHYLTAYSRVGSFELGALDRLVTPERALVEQGTNWVTRLVPVGLFPVFRSLREASERAAPADTIARIEAARPGYVDAVLAEVTERGPLAFGDLSDPGRIPVEERRTKYAASSVAWRKWSWGDQALKALVGVGQLAVAERSPSFEARYDLTERVVPAGVLARPLPSVAEAYLDLVRIAARAVGVGTVRDVAAHFHLQVTPTRKAVEALVASGELEQVAVQGWADKAYLSPGSSTRPLGGDVAALLSPFDPLLSERGRGVRLFGFEHVFEFYVPAAKRRYGYFVLPFLLGEHLVGRVDAAAQRKTSVLVVHGAYAEASHEPRRIAPSLGTALRSLADWLGLERVEVRDRGDLAPALRRSLLALSV